MIGCLQPKRHAHNAPGASRSSSRSTVERARLHTYLIRPTETVATIHTQRWLGDDLTLLYRGPATPDRLARTVVDDACTGLATTDDERATAASTLQQRLTRDAEIHVAEVTDLVRPGLAPVPTAIDVHDTPGIRYRLGIDDGQPGDCWLELGWDPGLGSFVGLEWARDADGQLLDVPERWHGTRPGEHLTATSLGDALGFAINPALQRQLVADQAAFPTAPRPERTAGLDTAFADLIDLPDDWPRYELTFNADIATVERYDWDGADPVHLGAGRWTDATIQSRIDADRADPWHPPLGDGPTWYRLNDHDHNGSWRVAYEPGHDGYVACHVDEQGEPTTDQRIGYDDRLTVTADLERGIGRPLPDALASTLRIDRSVFIPQRQPDLAPAIDLDL